jgi:hypothetical protein
MAADSPHENPYASPEAFGATYAQAADAFGRPETSDTPIFAEGTLTERDYLRAIKLHYRWGWYTARILVLTMVGVYLWFVYTLFRPAIGAGGWQTFFFSRGPLLLIALAAAGLLWTRQDSRVRRSWRKAPLSNEPFAYRITREVIELRSAASYGLQQWSCFRSYRATDDLVILASAYAANQLHVFPKRNFTPDDWDRFVALVTERLPKT